MGKAKNADAWRQAHEAELAERSAAKAADRDARRASNRAEWAARQDAERSAREAARPEPVAGWGLGLTASERRHVVHMAATFHDAEGNLTPITPEAFLDWQTARQRELDRLRDNPPPLRIIGKAFQPPPEWIAEERELENGHS